MQKNVCISIVSSSQCFDDVTLPLYYSLCRLGYNVVVMRNSFVQSATNIIIGLCDCPYLDLSLLPKDVIIYNFEQIIPGSKGVSPEYLQSCSHYPVWDYSEQNIHRFAQLGVTDVTYVPLGYCPEMSRIDPNYPKDIDVLFYGSINERRAAMIEALRRIGINAMAFAGTYGIDRDILIARSRIVMNIHYYLPGIQEIIRLSYLWANKKCVVCECNSDTTLHPGYENACIYSKLPKQACLIFFRFFVEKIISNIKFFLKVLIFFNDIF